jgi:hypothetical protein
VGLVSWRQPSEASHPDPCRWTFRVRLLTLESRKEPASVDLVATLEPIGLIRRHLLGMCLHKAAAVGMGLGLSQRTIGRQPLDQWPPLSAPPNVRLLSYRRSVVVSKRSADTGVG